MDKSIKGASAKAEAGSFEELGLNGAEAKAEAGNFGESRLPMVGQNGQQSMSESHSVVTPINDLAAKVSAGELGVDAATPAAAPGNVALAASGISASTHISEATLSLQSNPVSVSIQVPISSVASVDATLIKGRPRLIDEALVALDALENSMRHLRAFLEDVDREYVYGKIGHNSRPPITVADIDTSFVAFAALREELSTRDPKPGVLDLILLALEQTKKVLAPFLKWLNESPFGVSAQNAAGAVIGTAVGLAAVSVAIQAMGISVQMDDLIKLLIELAK